MTKVTFLLPESLKVFVDHQMAAKGYGSAGEYFRFLVHEAQKREEGEERLQRLLLEDLADGREE